MTGITTTHAEDGMHSAKRERTHDTRDVRSPQRQQRMRTCSQSLNLLEGSNTPNHCQDRYECQSRSESMLMHWGMLPRARARHKLGAHCRRRASSSSACTDRCAAAASASAASAGRPAAAAHSAHSVAAASRPPQDPPQQAATASGFHACSAAAAAGPDSGHIMTPSRCT